MAQLTMVLQILGHSISIGVGADIEKDAEVHEGQIQVVESTSTLSQPVGFVRDDDEWEAENGRGAGTFRG